MPLFFFHIEANGRTTDDDDGVEFSSVEAMQKEAMHVLPAIATGGAAKNGETATYKVLVKDEDHRPVYSAIMTLVGMVLSGG